MEQIRLFLEASSIHGLGYISTTRNCVRIFWALVVVTGFSGAGVMIYQSFSAWEESPVKTTVESQPITEIKFPRITVCPPKNTFTDLNYQLTNADNISLDDLSREKLANYSVELLYDNLYNMYMKNLSKLQDKDRYYNWYNGYDTLQLPKFMENYGNKNGYLNYEIEIDAISGSISTQYFGEHFDPDRVETDIKYNINFEVPTKIGELQDWDIKLHISIEQILMSGLTNGRDELTFTSYKYDPKKYVDSGNFSLMFPSDESGHRILNFERSGVTIDDIRKQKLNTMPGFRVSWYYEYDSDWYPNGLQEYQDHMDFNDITIAFVREFCSIFIGFY